MDQLLGGMFLLCRGSCESKNMNELSRQLCYALLCLSKQAGLQSSPRLQNPLGYRWQEKQTLGHQQLENAHTKSF